MSGGIASMLFAAGGGGGIYPLDGQTSGMWSCCWPFERMLTTATNAMRVRRSSDDVEADIGFDGSGLLDTTSLASFVGANSAYVVTIYDQTGNGRHITQATASRQPRIVNAGAYDGKLVADGTDDSMQGSNTIGTGVTVRSLFTKATLRSTATTQILNELTVNAAGAVRAHHSYYNQGSTRTQLGAFANSAADNETTYYSGNKFDGSVFCAQFAIASTFTATPEQEKYLRLYDDATLLTPTGGGTSGTAPNNTFSDDRDYWLARANASLFGAWDWYGAVIYHSALDATRITAITTALT